MIDVENTLYSTIQERVDRMRFLADSAPEAFKKIMYVIILKDLQEWAKYRGEECTAKQLQQKIDEYILRNPEFNIQRIINTKDYVNVNTPQTLSTWRRVWDDPNVIYNRYSEKNILPESYAYTPDPTCSPKFVYFNGVNEYGEPDVDRGKLSVCEKMNIYIDRETGTMWYIQEDGNWSTIKGDSVPEVEWDNIKNAPTIYSGIKHNLTEHNTVKVELLEDGDPSNEDIDLFDAKNVEELL